MLISPATRWHLGFHFLFLNSALLHSCIFWQQLFISADISLYSLPSINYFCWIDLVCIYRCVFRHIVGFWLIGGMPESLYNHELSVIIVIIICDQFSHTHTGTHSGIIIQLYIHKSSFLHVLGISALKLFPLQLTCLKTSGCAEFGPLNTKERDILGQNVFSQKQIIIQL